MAMEITGNLEIRMQGVRIDGDPQTGRQGAAAFSACMTAAIGAAEETAAPAKAESQRGTVMAEYYAKEPRYKETQERRVDDGYTVLAALGVSAEDIEAMSLDEFKGVMRDAIGSIPRDVTRPYDEEVINISPEGWENMKKDPDYAAWALGYIKEDRAVKNPFFGMGDKGAYDIRHFGASPAEYHGEVFSKIYGGTAAGARDRFNAATTPDSIFDRAPQADAQPPADYNLWEERRMARKRREQELVEEEIQSRILQRKYVNELLAQQRDEERAMLRSLDARGLPGGDMAAPSAPAPAVAALTATAAV